MFKTLIQKELKAILVSPKFIATFSTCTVLILLSVFIGIQEYNSNLKQYDTAKQLAETEMSQANSWMGIRNKIYREPDPLQIFVSGVNNDIGRFSSISNWIGIKLQNSIYSDDPIYAVFRMIDFSFIVLIVLSLFGIIFTYDSINGEKESGTLKLVFSNSVSRVKFVISKFVGQWLGLTIPLIIPILLSFLLLMVFKIHLYSEDWTKIILFMALSLLFFTFFIGLGVFISAVTKKSSISFLFLLMLWIVIIFIIPRIGIMISAQMVNVPTVAQMETLIDSYSRERWDKFSKEMSELLKKRNAEMAGMNDDEKESYREKNNWSWMEEDDKSRKQVEKDIAEYRRKADEDLRNKRNEQEKIALSISRISPASAYQLAVMDIAGTDITLKTRYEDQLQQYKNKFVEFIQKKQKESGDSGLFRIAIDSKTGIHINDGRKSSGLDLTELPKFKDSKTPVSAIMNSIMSDLGLLILFTIFSFLGAFVAFLRYDPR